MSTATITPIDADAGRDPRIEAMLDEHHVEWTFEPAFPLDQIDVQASLANQARIGDPLEAETVERYTVDYQRGDVFPALIARRRPRSKKVVLIGGNHRSTAAAAAGRATHPAYLIVCEPETAQVLSYSDNRLHGKPPSKLERLAQAAYLVEQGHTGKAAAAMLGVSEPDLSNYRKVASTQERANELGIGPEFRGLPRGTQQHLAAVGSDPVFSQATKVVTVCQMTAPQTADLVKRIKSARGDDAAMRVLGSEQEDRRAELQARAGRTAGRAERSGYSRVSSAVESILGADVAGVKGSLPPGDRDRFRRRIKDAAQRLMEIDKAVR